MHSVARGEADNRSNTPGAAARIITLSQAFGNPNIPLSDRGEKDWSFGQLLSMLVLILPLISALEILRGELAVPPPVDDDARPLVEEPLQENPRIRNSYQPSPFWGRGKA